MAWHLRLRRPQPDHGALVHRVGRFDTDLTFQADAGTKGETLLDLGGLTLKGYCRRQAGQIHLAVTVAGKASDNAAGTMNYMPSAGGQVVVEYAAAKTQRREIARLAGLPPTPRSVGPEGP